MELLTGIFSAFGLSASAGLNAYIPLLTISLLAKFTDLINLQSPWDTLTSWWVIGVLVVLGSIEFFADKIPAVNHINDIIQTFVRPIAGAIAFAASANVLTEISPILSMIAGLFIAGSVHTVKSAAVRPALTATTAGAANTPVSIAEDVISTFLSILAILIPIIIGIILVLLTITFIWWRWRKANANKIDQGERR
ncbi:MAG: DUF4126 domain-containing protein [Anaerolineae bacterium]|jgi:hypothetical protein|nr:DUF4126 domain-containing protein [Anaerolineae bacterium]MBT3713644.1 DUF4126 domain-containing protein [Anaerolineae bacterium]MBT4310091.1 DUF4126 domain-containing protein [Anaerolineae bacterium]MBT4457630.1 DUF4126 domain-containing protein [Anaerolineae bacterium]MBT4841125.1 DUF4126 domain-containing protein [Anaerolineae bacterium]